MPPDLTPEQLAIREQRKANKSKAQPTNTSLVTFLPRPWISFASKNQQVTQDALHLKILTFNLLAQCLIRRELFPTSHCLKASQREPMLHQEILSQNPDVLCLQEVDRLEKLIPVLESSGYSHLYAAGPRKKHGCMVAFKHGKFSKVRQHLVNYDQEEIRADGDNRARQGRSFQTKNIGLVVALRSTEDDKRGIVVATTHLFWHPKYHYERARQAGILVREINKHRTDWNLDHWPCIVAGDFNFTPDDPAYSLLVGDLLLPEQKSKISDSQIVHVSVDHTVPKSDKSIGKGEEAETVDPDRVITNARAATPADGLLSIAELEALFANNPKLRSVYDTGLNKAKAHGHSLRTFGNRVPLWPDRRGSCEPDYTSYTHYWKTVIDYIFVLDSIEPHCQILGLLAPHRSDNMDPGLPKDGVCGSDHISLVAELALR